MIKIRDRAVKVRRRREIRSPWSRRRTIQGVVVGVITRLDNEGVAYVRYPDIPEGPLPARTTVGLTFEQVGKEVALMFEEGDPKRPIIVGVFQHSQSLALPARQVQASIDDETITFTAKKEIVFQCGQASITLTREGAIRLRGTYLVSRSSGVNRIQGGSIELN